MTIAISELETLCRACALCCDGSLFGRVRLTPEETAPARRGKLRVVDSGGAFEQPCGALVDEGEGRRACSIHVDRPAACRAFTCRLYESLRRERGALEARLAVVRRVKDLLALGPREGPAFEELVHLIAEDFARA